MALADDTRSVAELISLASAQDPKDHDYWETVRVLQSLGTPEVFQSARQLCHSERSRDRVLGADLLGQSHVSDKNFPAEKVPILLQLLATDEEVTVLSSAVSALGQIGTPQRLEPLLTLKGHADPEVRFHVAIGLSQIDDARAIGALMELSGDPDHSVRDWATFGLGSQTDLDTPELREALFARVADTDDDTRHEALVGLAKRKDERILEPLVRELQNESLGLLALEAASEFADPRLCPALLKLREQWRDDDDSHTELLKEALVSCRCVSPDASQGS